MAIIIPNYIRKYVPFILLAIVFALATLIRIWAAPLSAGPDVGQFWAFAKTFQEHGLDFYRYASGKGAIFPIQGWSFVYPPIWLLILGLALVVTPLSTVSSSFIDTSWRVAMKNPLILSDLAIGGLLFWAIPGSKYRKLLFASLWLLNPAAWYESAVFGQFDTIAAAFLLVSVIMLERRKDWLAFMFAGLALLTKQHTVFSIVFMVIAGARLMSRQRLLYNCLIMFGLVVVFSVPFMITGNFLAYFRALLLSMSSPAYHFPLMFSFSGSASLLTYLHNTLGWQTLGLIQWSTAIFIVALTVAGVFCYRKSISPAQGILVGMLLFVALYYRINYQYLIIFIPIALFVAAKTPYKSERAIALAVALFPAIWVWLFNDSAWFYNFSPVAPQGNGILARLWLSHADLPDYAYVAFSVILMCLCLTYIILTFTRWHHKSPYVRQNTTKQNEPAYR